ncbi:hypothetical protein H4R33_005665 [Dimargaris cristalligena]|uniref:Protein PET100, mitochondrial n=1 Tax=Dimargaris cristalligena TaxID=215637 RepID=A0A4Q0A4W3_9FUNG|nr:hypothetical protein H4R33_005665 [Dimargaris cristalligena]RKP40290.1 hypothetical protein BJ085DRAFT_37013 [Dimargaris cristalligena]|eukprot:RKP40290.1 hypothetical protein BJ085DRAFT_37013 [Dimargaris cristalligena]
MAGPRMEVFRFGIYVFFPIAIMIYFGDPTFYDRHVRQALKDLYPPPEECNKVGTTRSEIMAQLEEIKKARAAKRANEPKSAE